jgi:acetylornithine deacetylase/succinyl-diaminopimelate desuccinylase-like protein
MNGHDGGDGRAPGARMDGGAAAGWEDVDAAILAGAEAAFSFLERLVAAPSTVGHEREAQELVAAELARIGFDVTWPAVPEHTAAAAPGGVAQASYRGRANVLGRLNPGGSPSLLLNGHVDVVPAEAELWSSDLASIVAGARTLARFIARFFAAGPAVPRAGTADATGSRAPAGSEGGGP